MRWLCLKLIRLYQVAISSWLPPSCIYTPTGSQYALEAIQQHGALADPFGAWTYEPLIEDDMASLSA